VEVEVVVETVKREEVKQEIVPTLPIIDLTEIQIRPQPRLQIESSILQVNTL
jgi:hypothetical protein